MRKIATITVVLTLLVLLAMPSKASPLVFEDEKGDVADILTQSNISKSGTDIKRLIYYQYDSGKVIVSLEVYGEIDPHTYYTVALTTTEGNKKIGYAIAYLKSEEIAKNLGVNETVNKVLAVENESFNKTISLDHKFEIINKDTLRVTFNLLSPGESIREIAVMTWGLEWNQGLNGWFPRYMDFLNCTVEQSQPQQTDNENQTQPSNNENQQDNKGSPGFEAILLLPAILIALLILRNKKNL